MAFPVKKKQTSGTVDNQNTTTKQKPGGNTNNSNNFGNKPKPNPGTKTGPNTDPKGTPVQSQNVTSNQVHGAISAFVAKKNQMSKKTKKKVAGKLKGLKAKTNGNK